jgi:hypothetical protein
MRLHTAYIPGTYVLIAKYSGDPGEPGGLK